MTMMNILVRKGRFEVPRDANAVNLVFEAKP